jgi:CHAT domain-containing protein
LLFEENINIFQQLISILYDLGVQFPNKGYHKQAFRYAELSRARTFLDQLQEQAARNSFKLPPAIAAEESRLKSQLAKLDKNIFTELSKPKAKRNQAQVEQWQLDKNQLQTKFKDLTKRLEKDYPAYASLKYPKVYDVPVIQKDLLNKNSQLIAFVVGDNRSFGFLVRKENFRMVLLPPSGDIDRLIRKYRKTLVNPLIFPDEDDEDIVIDNTQSHLATGLQLYQVLLSKLTKDTPANINELIVIPDGVIYYLPFETVLRKLHSGSQKFAMGREYLLHKYSIVYTPSASVQGAITLQANLRSPEKLAKRKDFLGFGDPEFKPRRKQKKGFKYNPTFKQQGFYDLDRLYNTITELQQISSLFGESQTTFLRKKALESTVKKNISNYKYIHFATHGILDEKNPEFSGVVMNIVQKDQKEDGFLQASEIFDLHLNADLVTLSACETGLGKVIKGEGMVGLTRAFLFAGTPSIIVSLWTVADESTSKLMIHFYTFLKQGLNKDESLRKAKIALMKDSNSGTGEKFHDPFYWGPFILNGVR